MSKPKSSPRCGTFRAEPSERERMVQSMCDGDADWCSTGGKIWVKCWIDPHEFELVEADVVWTSKVMRAR